MPGRFDLTRGGDGADETAPPVVSLRGRGLLRGEWDPRISPVLETTYDYQSQGSNVPPGANPSYGLVTLTPPGQDPWTFSYYNQLTGQVVGASRQGQSTVSTWTVWYDVPVTGHGAPYDMSAGQVANWTETDAPVTATAILPPDDLYNYN